MSLLSVDQKIVICIKEIYHNIFLSFLISTVATYLSLIVLLPYILEISFFLAAFFMSVTLGTCLLITSTMIFKLLKLMILQFKSNQSVMAKQIINARNTFLFTHTRYS